MGRRENRIVRSKAHKTYCVGISGQSGDDEQKHECRDELKEESFSSANLRYGGDPRIHRMIDALDSEGGSNGAQHLCSHIRQDVSKWEVAKYSHGDADCWVQVAARYVDEGQHKNSDS